MDLTDEQWLLLQPLIAPYLPPLSALGGRPPLDERRILDGILWKLRHNAPWYDLPSAYPSHQSCYRRYRQWQRLGLLKSIYQALYWDCLQRGGVNALRAVEDGLVAMGLEDGEWHFRALPHLQDTWQLSVIQLFLGLAVRRMKTTRLVRCA